MKSWSDRGNFLERDGGSRLFSNSTRRSHGIAHLAMWEFANSEGNHAGRSVRRRLGFGARDPCLLVRGHRGDEQMSLVTVVTRKKTCAAVWSIASCLLVFLPARVNAAMVTGWGLGTGAQAATLTEGVPGSF